MEQRLSLITLGVADLARSRQFYETGLGFVKNNDEATVAFYQLPGMVLALWSRAELAQDAGLVDSGPAFGGFALAQNVGSPAEVDAVLTAAAVGGGTITKAGAATDWGGCSGYFTDPDGHPWEVAHNPFWTVHPDGRTTLR